MTRESHVTLSIPPRTRETTLQLNDLLSFAQGSHRYTMFNRPATTLLGLLALCLTLVVAASTKDKLQIGVKYKPDECPLKSRNGDRLSMQ